MKAYPGHPDMECMLSQREPCEHACSHVGLKKAVFFLSFAICLLFVWNICLQHQLFANMGTLNGCNHSQDSLRNEMKINSENPDLQGLSRLRRSGNVRVRDRVNTLEAKVRYLEAAIYKPIVHLTMSNSLNNSILYDSVNNIGYCVTNVACLRWDTPLAEYRDVFNYVKDGYNMPVAIGIRSPGTYNVYAQLAINGADQSFHYDPTIGYEVVLARGQHNVVLLKGLVTQDGRGRRYHNTPNKPVDTVPVFGTFKLLCDDKVFVRLLEYTTVSYNNLTSYFGMVRANPTSALSSGDYRCNPPA